MGLLKSISDLVGMDVSEFEGTWEMYRNMTRDNIVHYSDDEVRDLHAKMSFLLSQAEVSLGDSQANLSSASVKAKLKKSELIITIYPDGAFNQRTAQVEADHRYQDLAMKESNAEAEVELWKGRVHATQTATELLSREITARLKK